MDQIVTQPTRITETISTILEHFFTTNTSLINKVETIPGISDHGAVFIESSLRPMKVKTPPRKVFQYRKADYSGMKSDLLGYQHEFEEGPKQKMLNVSCPPSKRRYIPSWTNTFPQKCSELTRFRNYGFTSSSRALEGNKRRCLNDNVRQG